MENLIALGLKQCSPTQDTLDLLIIPAWKSDEDEVSATYTSPLVNQLPEVVQDAGIFAGNKTQTLSLYGLKLEDVLVKEVLILGLGKKSASALSAEGLQACFNQVGERCTKRKVVTCAIDLRGLDMDASLLRLMSQAVVASAQTVAKKEATLQQLNWLVNESCDMNACTQALQEGLVIGQAKAWGMSLANRPANKCKPTDVVEAVKAHFADTNAQVEALVGQAAIDRGLTGLAAVGQGSDEPVALIHLTYNGCSGDKVKAAPIALIGKGVTFDAGGLCIKPGARMWEMKYDMTGAAMMLAAFDVAVRLALPIHLTATVALCENLPSGKAIKPGDVIAMHNGKTVEVTNTDAEGRLILADALSFAGANQPKAVVIAATLTGACVAALGGAYTGLFTRNEAEQQQWLQYGKDADDAVWPLPLAGFDHVLDSDVADYVNWRMGQAGASRAALFLEAFIPESAKDHWVHLDIAGSSVTEGKHIRATGRPLNLLVQYLCAQV